MKPELFEVIELSDVDEPQIGQVIEVLARWHTAEWGHLYPPDVWNLEAARREFAEQRATAVGPPTTYVAFIDGELVGSVSLLTTDDLEGFDHVGPWLASLYVTPAQRRRGLGRRLIAHVLAQPQVQDTGRVYLFTAEHESWYASLGWRTVASTTSGPGRHPVTVMVTTAAAAEGSAPPPHPRV